MQHAYWFASRDITEITGNYARQMQLHEIDYSMWNKRYALIVRLWRVKSKPVPKENEPEPEIQVVPSIHWRGAVQLAGETTVRYFDSLTDLNLIIEELVNQEPGAQ